MQYSNVAISFQVLGSAAALGSFAPLSVFAQTQTQPLTRSRSCTASRPVAGDSVARRVAEKLGGTAYSEEPGFCTKTNPVPVAASRWRR